MSTQTSEIQNEGGGQFGALSLCGFSLANYFLFYGVNILLARTLTTRGFDDYNVAVSTVLVLTTLATLGLEKFALKCLPVFQERKSWPEARGFLRFSVGITIGVSILLALLLNVTLSSTLALRGGDAHLAITIIGGFLPVIAVFLLLLEVATAYHAPLQAVAIYRLLLPASIALLNGLVFMTIADHTALTAAFCYVGGWSFVLCLAVILVTRKTPREVWGVKPVYQRRQWLKKSLPLLINSVLMTLLAQSGVIILELVRPNQPVVSIYAMAAHTGTFVVLVGTSTNRFYLPQVSLLLEHRDSQGLKKLAQKRLALIGPLAILFLIVIFTAGQKILGLFGPEYTTGYSALCLIAASTTISTLFSAAPYYLQFADKNRLVISWTAATVLTSIALCIPLGYYFGATGAAFAYAVPMTVLYLAMRFLGLRHVKRELGAD